MQESRLFKILYYLLDKGHATAPELAERFEVSTRTVYRDIDALSGAGIPVYAEAGRGGGIYLMNHFVLDRAMLTEEEKQDILSALQSVAAAGNKGGEATLEKLSALFQIQSENWYEVDFARWGVSTGDHEKFELLKKAVLTHRRVKIFYAGAGREKSYRTVEPLKLLYKSRAWYLKAYCLEKEAFRLFKLNRILEWEVLGESFVPGTFPEPEAVPQQSPPQPETPQVILSFPGEMAYRVYDEFDCSQIRELENGSLLVTA
ncbi:MAG: YafY family transcriptional regulator, partial [Lachnospiraceae bacterium]|nr:YafY family transcriptional regulator [Lachnospiraceae bacterium]